MTFCFLNYLVFIYAGVKSNVLLIGDVFDTVNRSLGVVITRKGHRAKRKCAVFSATPDEPSHQGQTPHLEVLLGFRKTCFGLIDLAH